MGRCVLLAWCGLAAVGLSMRPSGRVFPETNVVSLPDSPRAFKVRGSDPKARGEHSFDDISLRTYHWRHWNPMETHAAE
jgi:hypothetical protein